MITHLKMMSEIAEKIMQKAFDVTGNRLPDKSRGRYEEKYRDVIF